MTEIRCVKCNRLLMKVGSITGNNGEYSAALEVKCPKCGYKAIYQESKFNMQAGYFRTVVDKNMKEDEWYIKQ